MLRIVVVRVGALGTLAGTEEKKGEERGGQGTERRLKGLKVQSPG